MKAPQKEQKLDRPSKKAFFDNQKLFDFISEGEGAFQEKAFCDSYYKTGKELIRHPPHLCTRWSIGFGTVSYPGEKITLEEGIKRRNEDILRRKSLITSTCLSESQMIAVIDFMYQHGNNSSNIKNYANACKIKDIYWTFAWWRDEYKSKNKWGLVKREQRRINYFYGGKAGLFNKNVYKF